MRYSYGTTDTVPVPVPRTGFTNGAVPYGTYYTALTGTGNTVFLVEIIATGRYQQRCGSVNKELYYSPKIKAMLEIREILVRFRIRVRIRIRMRIRGSVPLTNKSGYNYRSNSFLH